MNSVTYDTGALIAAERDLRSVWRLHRRLIERGMRPALPTVVLGQAWRGGPQGAIVATRARVSHRAVHRAAGAHRRSRARGERQQRSDRRGRRRHGPQRDDMIVTSDPDDLRRIASALGRSVELYVPDRRRSAVQLELRAIATAPVRYRGANRCGGRRQQGCRWDWLWVSRQSPPSRTSAPHLLR